MRCQGAVAKSLTETASDTGEHAGTGEKLNPSFPAFALQFAMSAYCVVVVVVVAVGLFVVFEAEAAAATATTATAAATMPAVMPPAAAPVAEPASPLAGACASALPTKNTDVITKASVFFIFISD